MLDPAIHVLDFEGHRDYGVIEYGIVTIENRRITAVQQGLCEAIGEIHPSETRLHGLRRGDTLGFPPFSALRDDFLDLRSGGILAAHHASTEEGLLKLHWPFPRFSPDWLRPGEQTAEWSPWLDSWRLAEALCPQLSEHKLQAVVEALELQDTLTQMAAGALPANRQRYHCAGYDALASALLLLFFLQRCSIAEALRLSNPRRARTLWQNNLPGLENNAGRGSF